MQDDNAILDHVVVNVQARLDAGVAAYGNLGFSLTERGHHTLGTFPFALWALGSVLRFFRDHL